MSKNNFTSVDTKEIDLQEIGIFIGQYIGIETIAKGTPKEFERFLFADVETGELVAIPNFMAIDKAIKACEENKINPLECIFKFEYIEKTQIGSKTFHKISSGYILAKNYK